MLFNSAVEVQEKSQLSVSCSLTLSRAGGGFNPFRFWTWITFRIFASANAMKRGDLSEIYLETIWCGQLLFNEFDGTMTTIFFFFWKKRKNTLLTVTFMSLANISVLLVVLITLRPILELSGGFGEIKKFKMAAIWHAWRNYHLNPVITSCYRPQRKHLWTYYLHTKCQCQNFKSRGVKFRSGW